MSSSDRPAPDLHAPDLHASALHASDRPSSDLHGERVDYTAGHLLESAAPPEPYALFRRWLEDAFAARDAGTLAEPTAMVVATLAAGRPRARPVLRKELAVNRPAHVPDAPTHAGLVAAAGGSKDATVYAAADDVTGASPEPAAAATTGRER